MEKRKDDVWMDGCMDGWLYGWMVVWGMGEGRKKIFNY